MTLDLAKFDISALHAYLQANKLKSFRTNQACMCPVAEWIKHNELDKGSDRVDVYVYPTFVQVGSQRTATPRWIVRFLRYFDALDINNRRPELRTAEQALVELQRVAKELQLELK